MADANNGAHGTEEEARMALWCRQANPSRRRLLINGCLAGPIHREKPHPLIIVSTYINPQAAAEVESGQCKQAVRTMGTAQK